MLEQNGMPSGGRSQADSFNGGGGGKPAYAPLPASFRMPTHDGKDPSQTLVNIINPTPLTPMQDSQSILDCTPTNDRPNSVFPLSYHDDIAHLSSSASPSSSFEPGGGQSFSLESELSRDGSSFSPSDFDADLFQRLVAGSVQQGQLPMGTSAFSPYGSLLPDEPPSFLDLNGLHSSMDTDHGTINPFEFDPSFMGGATSDSEGYASSTVSTDGSSMRMGSYFASRKRPSEEGIAAPGHSPNVALTRPHKQKKTKSVRSSGKTSSTQDQPAFGSLGQLLPPPSVNPAGSRASKRRKSFDIGPGGGEQSSTSPPSPRTAQHSLGSTVYGQGPVFDSPPSTDEPLRRTNSNPHPASFSAAQPAPGHNTFYLPRSTSNSPAQPINKHLPIQPASQRAHRSQPKASLAPAISNIASTPSLAGPSRSRQNSAVSALASSSASTCTSTSHTSPSSVTSSSNAGLGPVVETNLEWVPSKPRIRKSIRRRLEKKRDDPPRMTHVLDGRPPPAVEVKVSSSASKSKAAKGKKKARDTGAASAAEDSATEGGSRPKKSRPLHPPAAGTLAAGVRRKGRASSVSSVEGPPTPARPRSAASTGKGKGKAVIGGSSGRVSIAGSVADTEEDSGMEDEEDEVVEGPEERMERMLRDFEHLGTELPPRVFEGGVSQLMPEKKKGKIPGSAMDRLPAIDARFDALEQGIQSYIKAVARRSFQNSMLPGLDFPTSEVQDMWASLDGHGDFVPSPAYHSLSSYQEDPHDADDEAT